MNPYFVIPLSKIKSMSYLFQNKEYHIERYPKTEQNALKAWNAADELMLGYLENEKLLSSKMAIYHDQFGFLSTLLSEYQPILVILYSSQHKAIQQNIQQNGKESKKISFIYPLDELKETIDIALMKIPKSVDLFELYLQQLGSQKNNKTTLIGGFMTKYFSKQMLSVAGRYYEEVEQTRAHKKARLLILKKPKKIEKQELIREIKLDEHTSFKQYYGVFSAKHIDYASQFLMDHIQVLDMDRKIMDLGTGNGVLAWKIRQLSSEANINLLDDDYLAIESAKLNMKEGSNYYHFSDGLLHLSNNSFDLVVSNPPFHFEYENNIEVSLDLFRQVWKILKPGGRFQVVANQHLNYKTHLQKIFRSIEITAENDKFIVYSCTK